jgi:hypothetical protein
MYQLHSCFGTYLTSWFITPSLWNVLDLHRVPYNYISCGYERPCSHRIVGRNLLQAISQRFYRRQIREIVSHLPGGMHGAGDVTKSTRAFNNVQVVLLNRCRWVY